MNYPYMPKSTALWLIENTALTFEQIGEFCGLHELEVKKIADAESNKMQGLNPIINGQVTREDIARCEADPNARLVLREEIIEAQKKQNIKGGGYTPKLHRQNRLGGILWILKNYPDLKANTNFIELQKELTETEDKIAYARQFYNDTVLMYNNAVEVFPNNIVAGMFGFKRESFFEANEKERMHSNVISRRSR